MNAPDPREAFLATMGRELHRAGIATDAIEESLTQLARSVGLQAQVFALPTYITIALGPDWNQRTVMMRLDPGRVSLRKIALLNEIYDRLRGGRIDFEAATKLLDEVDVRWPGLPAWYEIPALTLIAIGVALILGGGPRELGVSATIGFVTGALSVVASRSPVVTRLFDVVAAFLATLIVAAFIHFVGPTNVYVSIVAGIVVLLPGYTLTLALHELANDFLVAGMARLGKVLAVLLALGCGAFLALAMVPSLLRGGALHTHPVSATWWFVASVCLAIGMSIDLDARLRDVAWVFAASFVALLCTHVLSATSAHAVAPFIAAFICGMVANVGARFLRVPQAIMLVPALIVLVPGSLSYESLLFAFTDDVNGALILAGNAIVAAIQLVAGLLLSQLVLPASALRLRQGSRQVR
ncbi:MAG TPA: threonine/serine exporter family protein [Candidatus Acidoferrales bacterium]|nr:threonine/serine exporter family protein [Candidatus Acidoferrales bacterium]